MRLIKDSTTNNYHYDEDGFATTVIEELQQFHYDSEEEREKHVKEMIVAGFHDSGQVQENVGTLKDPKYVWFASYYKLTRMDKGAKELKAF